MFSVTENSGVFLLETQSGVVKTPTGTPIGSRHRELIQLISDHPPADVHDPSQDSIGPFGLTCSYLDFAIPEQREHLIEAICGDMMTDIVFDLPPSPNYGMYLRACYTMGLEQLGISPGFSGGCDKEEVASRLRAMTMRQIMAVVVFSANFGSPALGLALVVDEASATPIGQAICPLVQDYACGDISTQEIKDCDEQWCTPDMFDLDYCADTCCTDLGYPKDLNQRCGFRSSLELFQRVARFPDELE